MIIIMWESTAQLKNITLTVLDIYYFIKRGVCCTTKRQKGESAAQLNVKKMAKRGVYCTTKRQNSLSRHQFSFSNFRLSKQIFLCSYSDLYTSRYTFLKHFSFSFKLSGLKNHFKNSSFVVSNS